MAWSIDLQNADGTALVSGVAWGTASVTWVIDGPGAIEVDLAPADMTGNWRSGLRRIILKNGATAVFGGWLTYLSRRGRTAAQDSYQASALGLSSILDYRLVHGDFSRVDTVATTIAWNLIQHTQAQLYGNAGFTFGTIDGTAPARTRYFCDGDNIGDAIRELAALEPGGFDWEISPAGAFNAWVGGRGASPAYTIDDTAAQDYTIVAETSDLATFATAMQSDSDAPCGPALVTRQDDLASVYPRREVLVEIDSGDADDLNEAADQEMRGRTNARLEVTATWIESKLPWPWGAVWLGDLVPVTMPVWFGGSQYMKVNEVRASLEPGGFVWVTYKFAAMPGGEIPPGGGPAGYFDLYGQPY